MHDQIKHKIEIPKENGEPISLELKEGEVLFLLGANGSGKSALFQHLYNINIELNKGNLEIVKRIFANRSLTIYDTTVNITASNRIQKLNSITYHNREYNSRYRSEYANERIEISLYDLVSSENEVSRKIKYELKNGNTENATKLANKHTPLEIINNLLEITNFPFKIELNNNDTFYVRSKYDIQYTISELSDGERNALLICSEVLTAKPNSLILIDEPERHLHRSIISPLIANLIKIKSDCSFVVATHDCTLPIDIENSKIVVLRGCKWNGLKDKTNTKVENWNADYIENTDSIPEDVKYEILGSKKKVLFVEGVKGGLDQKLYELVFPEVTVIPVGNCKDVEKAVKGLRNTKLHWVEAFGLIDVDFRTKDDKIILLQNGIATLDCYSVEGIYYNLEMIEKVAEYFENMLSRNKSNAFNNVKTTLPSTYLIEKEELCNRKLISYTKKLILEKIPTKIDDVYKPFEISSGLKQYEEEILTEFDFFITENDMESLLKNYPIKKTQIKTSIFKGLDVQEADYISAVLKIIKENQKVKESIRNRLSDLTKLIEGKENGKEDSSSSTS